MIRRIVMAAAARLVPRAALLAAAAAGLSAQAQIRQTDHTFRLAEGADRPAATLADVSWLVGDWVGEAFGQTFEEVWNPPSAGSMAGMFKLLDGDAVSLYELMLLVEEEGSLALKVKHFDADFTAWEEKSGFLDFELVRVDEDAIHFSGLSFRRIGPDELEAYIVVHRNGEIHEERLSYRRRR